MASTSAFIKIGSLVFSLIIGIIFFYVTNKSPKKEKKQQLDQFMSYLINFILFIWAGKIILHIQIFFQDPFAVLAYPSDSRSIYIATLLLIIQVIYRKIRKQLLIRPLVNTMVAVFLATSFVYEFIALMMMDSKTGLRNLILMTVLLVLYILLQEKMLTNTMTNVVIISYSVVHIIFYFITSYTLVFGYMLHPFYFVIILLFIMFEYIYYKKLGRKVI